MLVPGMDLWHGSLAAKERIVFLVLEAIRSLVVEYTVLCLFKTHSSLTKHMSCHSH